MIYCEKKYDVSFTRFLSYRNQVKSGSEIGKKAKEFMDAGKLVPDDIVVPMVAKQLQSPQLQASVRLTGIIAILNRCRGGC